MQKRLIERAFDTLLVLGAFYLLACFIFTTGVLAGEFLTGRLMFLCG
jgi:hypothetical protein